MTLLAEFREHLEKRDVSQPRVRRVARATWNSSFLDTSICSVCASLSLPSASMLSHWTSFLSLLEMLLNDEWKIFFLFFLRSCAQTEQRQLIWHHWRICAMGRCAKCGVFRTLNLEFIDVSISPYINVFWNEPKKARAKSAGYEENILVENINKFPCSISLLRA